MHLYQTWLKGKALTNCDGLPLYQQQMTFQTGANKKAMFHLGLEFPPNKRYKIPETATASLPLSSALIQKWESLPEETKELTILNLIEGIQRYNAQGELAFSLGLAQAHKQLAHIAEAFFAAAVELGWTEVEV